MKILIAGGTGFVGKELTSFLSQKGYKINVLTRREYKNKPNIQYYSWDLKKDYIDKKAFEGVSAIINLTGASIAEKRWTNQRKNEILESRVKSITLLHQYTSMNNFPIQTLISSSAVGYYGAITSKEVFTEASKNGNDFLGSVCSQWEQATQAFDHLGCRVVILRKGVIVGKNGAFNQKLASLAKLGINPCVGSGSQYVPWIDLRDLVRLYDSILQDSAITGVYNATASQHISMEEIAHEFLHHFGKRKLTPNAPSFIIQLLFGELSSMMLEGSRVSNERIKNKGFQFKIENFRQTFN
ncbi:MAG TPA: TIGR01777 family oxidoreductase [Chitinophagales bacterium]|nr:TIGR01777 family oxidoreductase [Chitinophagales bacterium]